MMTEDERTAIADKLLALLFSLREPNEQGEAWVLTMLTNGMARAILASVGPRGDEVPLVDIARQQTLEVIAKTRQQFLERALTAPAMPRRQM